MKAIADTDVEVIVNNLRCSTGKFDAITKDILENHLQSSLLFN